MPQATAFTTVPARGAPAAETLARSENPGRAFANGVLLALPLWGLIGVAIWSLV